MNQCIYLLAATLGLCALAAEPAQAADTKAAPAPSCAKAESRSSGATIYRNQCDYPVYWEVQCAVGARNCGGNGTVEVEAKSQTSITYTAAVDIWGPYKR